MKAKRTIIAIFMLSAGLLLAQEKANSGGGHAEKAPDKDELAAMADFSRMMAMQANEVQQDQIHQLLADTDAALSKPSAAASDHAQKIHKEVADLLDSFSKSQKQYLKDNAKDLRKSDTEVEKAAKSDPQGVSAALKKLKEQELKLADLMGVQPAKPAESK